MVLTRRQNLQSVLRGQRPQWVPFAPNFWQWFNHHSHFNTLPAELAGCKSYIEAQRRLGCDIFTRNVFSGYREIDTVLKPKVDRETGPLGERVTVEYHTSRGAIRSVTQKQRLMSTSHQEEYFCKDWAVDGAATRELLMQKDYRWDMAVFEKLQQEIGGDGLVNVGCGCTPLKIMHHYLGLEYTCLFVLDEPEAAREFCGIHWSKLRPVLRQMADHPLVTSVILMDNVDSPFYTPNMVAEYWEPYVKEAADLLVSRGKTLFVHACGKLALLDPVFARCGVSGLEGVSHAPLGDYPARQAQQCHPGFIFNGGFSAHEQESLSDAQVRDFYRTYLEQSARERFIFSSSCQTSIGTTWDRIRLVRDICRQWGGDCG